MHPYWNCCVPQTCLERVGQQAWSCRNQPSTLIRNTGLRLSRSSWWFFHFFSLPWVWCLQHGGWERYPYTSEVAGGQKKRCGLMMNRRSLSCSVTQIFPEFLIWTWQKSHPRTKLAFSYWQTSLKEFVWSSKGDSQRIIAVCFLDRFLSHHAAFLYWIDRNLYPTAYIKWTKLCR